MALTLANLETHVTHSLGQATPTTPGAAKQIVNEAGRALYSAHPWRFRDHAASAVDIVASQSYITLPTDFGELQAWQADGLTQQFEMTTLGEVLALRSKGIHPVGFIWYGAIVHSESDTNITAGALLIKVLPAAGAEVLNAIEVEITEALGVKTIRVEVVSSGQNATGTLGDGNTYETLDDVKAAIDGITTPATFSIETTVLNGTFSGSTDAAVLHTVAENTLGTGDEQTLTADYAVTNMVPQIELYPTPTATRAGGVRIYYRREWKELNASGDIPNIPAWCESLLIQYVRTFAEAYSGRAENATLANMSTATAITSMLASIESGHLFKSAVRRDASSQRHYGVLRGGASSSTPRIGPFDSRPVSSPFIT